MLQCVTLCITLCYTMLQCVTLCITLCITMCYNVLQCVTMYYTMLHYVLHVQCVSVCSVCYGMCTQCVTVCYTVLVCVTRCNTTLYCRSAMCPRGETTWIKALWNSWISGALLLWVCSVQPRDQCVLSSTSLPSLSPFCSSVSSLPVHSSLLFLFLPIPILSSL